MDWFALVAAPALVVGLVVFVGGALRGSQEASVLGLFLVVLVWFSFGMGW